MSGTADVGHRHGLLPRDAHCCRLAAPGSPRYRACPPLPTSPAIDAGNDAVCPRWDQLGQRRVDIPGVGTSRCDIGAIEVQPRDTTPPAILVTATPETLWPPNGQLVPITITGTITDVGSGVDPDTAVFAVMDAYGSPQPRDHITLGKDGSYTCTPHLQASRKGNDTNGRQYTIRPYRREAATRAHFGELFSPDFSVP